MSKEVKNELVDAVNCDKNGKCLLPDTRFKDTEEDETITEFQVLSLDDLKEKFGEAK